MIRIDDFDYKLPGELIAQEPLAERDECKLLCVSRSSTRHKKFYDLAKMLTANDVLVVNRSKVFKARLMGIKESGGKAEVLLLRKVGANLWQALGRGVKDGRKISFGGKYWGIIKKKRGEEVEIEINFGDKIIEKIGRVPTPPYIKSKKDFVNEYQNIYAREVGSSAAPTAGFHFSLELKKKLMAKGVGWEEVVLHVGLGTFKKVEEENIILKKLHSEKFMIDKKTAARLNLAKREGKRIIAVGTTAMRVLESVAENGQVQPKVGETDIFIYPPYRFKFVDSLITNFHLPKTSLLMLVAAAVGEKRWREIYKEAIARGYRFYSFGDAMWIEKLM
jgi:S-adenosylmethionine:tRNA ribosyltransferase-isomerase